MRLFIAFDPDPAAAAHLGEVLAGLAVSSGRVAPPERWHITLAFLGEVADGAAAGAAAAVEGAAASVAAPLRVRLGGGGRFGRGRFTVLWTGLGGDVDGLRQLASAVRRELKRRRLPVDTKPYRPHLTLARPGDRLTPEQLAADLAVLQGYEGPEWTVEAIHLYQSHLGPKPSYTRLASAALPI